MCQYNYELSAVSNHFSIYLKSQLLFALLESRIFYLACSSSINYIDYIFFIVIKAIQPVFTVWSRKMSGKVSAEEFNMVMSDEVDGSGKYGNEFVQRNTFCCDVIFIKAYTHIHMHIIRKIWMHWSSNFYQTV